MALYSINRFMNIDADAVSKVYKESVESILKEAPEVTDGPKDEAPAAPVEEAADVTDGPKDDTPAPVPAAPVEEAADVTDGPKDDTEDAPVDESAYIDSLLDSLNA